MLLTAPLAHADTLRLIVQEGYLPPLPVLVRVEVRTGAGLIQRDLWDAEAILSVDPPQVSLSTNRVTLRNGLGSALVWLTGGGDVNLTATLGNLQATRLLGDLTSVPSISVSGTLTNTNASWSGVVRVTGDLTIPAGSTLTIRPGTLVLLSGVASGTTATDLIVNGTIRSLGTEAQPVTITCGDPGLRWGQIRHSSSQLSTYAYTSITLGGRAAGEGHTGTGPVIRPSNSRVSFESCSITDHADSTGQPGKIMLASGSELTFVDCLLARSRMGPEIMGTALYCADTWFMEMRGPDDADGIYIHTQNSGQIAALRGCVMVGGDDDGIDTYGSDITVDDSIIRDWPNPNEDAKGISVFHGETTVRRTLIANCYVGISAKSSGPLSRVNIAQSTVTGITRGVSAAYKSNATVGNVDFRITNSVVLSPDPVYSDFAPTNFTIGYCDLGEAWPGAGNFSADPRFVDSVTNFHLLAGSPCIDAGDPTASIDPDHTRADVGAYPFMKVGPATRVDGVVISEIMYHPASENVLEEYIELYNRGTNVVNVSGWRLSSGVLFTFPTNTIIPGGGHLVVAADRATFLSSHPGVTSVVGNWDGILSNRDEDLNLDDAAGQRVDSVHYADEGDWTVRRRGVLHYGHRGWSWSKEHDGGGRALELINPHLSNNQGQNWAASAVTNGTPGTGNSVHADNVAPLIVDATHAPIVPRSTDAVLVTMRVLDERTNGVIADLFYRVDAITPLPFAEVPMFDDGQHDDGAPGDGIFGVTLPPRPNNTVVEFYVRAIDFEGLSRTWPAPILDTDGTALGQVANLLYQVDDAAYSDPAPLYKLIMRESERAELAAIGLTTSGEPSNEHLSDAQMNGTFVSLDGSGLSARYLVGVRNRGHGSRTRQPNSYRVNFRSDDAWKGVVALNLNGQYTHAQILGSVLCQKAGLAAANSRAVQVRVNNTNLGREPQTYGNYYAANEVLNTDWAEDHFPNDSSGNVYRANRDISPSDFAYRGANHNAYTNTWFKETNESEDDWTDLIGMLRVVGTNDLFTVPNVGAVANVEQWLLHLAVMALFDNRETGLNSAYNDDYFMYAGIVDPRFILIPYDVDTILNEGSVAGATNATIFGAVGLPAFNRLMHHPDFEPIYYQTLQRLLETTFSAEQFNPTVDQVLGKLVPENVTQRIKTWMAGRRAYVLSLIAPFLPPPANLPIATISGEPRSPTPLRIATLTVGGTNITHYRYKLNGGSFGAETPVNTAIQLTGLADGSTNTVYVIGKNLAGVWQDTVGATASRAWVVRTSTPSVRLNEVLAHNVAAVAHGASFPDLIELFNEGAGAVDLSGLRLSDNPLNPGKFVFPSGTSLAAGGYLVVYANNADGTSGFHLGFGLDQDGEGVYLFDRVDRGGALLDAVTFGLQLPDLSLGRLGSAGAFVLTRPTFGSANSTEPLGDLSRLRINEWLADELSLYPTDFIELHNPEAQPVALGGLYLTDNPVGWPTQHSIAPLSFIGGNGYRAFKADADPEQGADHLNFRLAAEQGMVALLAPDQSVIDCVYYGPQRTDVSEGRSPNGANTIDFFLQPTPGLPNPLVSAGIVSSTNVLVAFTNVWRYNQTQDLTAVNWTATNYNDSSWPTGPALLAYDPDPLPVPKNTPLTLGRTTYYFRTRFNFNGDPANANLRLSAMIDDGAVFYLNGQKAYRLGMPDQATYSYGDFANRTVNNAALEGPFQFPRTNLVVGDNVLAVEVHQVNQTSGDIALGATLESITSVTNVGPMPVVLSEVLANSLTVTNAGGLVRDWVELFNPSTSPVDLSDMSLSDDMANPRKWVFPAGASVPAGGYLIIECDGQAAPSDTNTGFGLGAGGGGVYFFNRTTAQQAWIDGVTYGLQAADLSLGRIGGALGTWNLTRPTPGAANAAVGLGNASVVRINEWMANPAEGDDWFELYNPGGAPVELSGLALTDDLADRNKSPIPALSFIGTGEGAFCKFIADGSTGKGADHVAFSLAGGGERIGLFTATGIQIDAVTFGAQTTGVSQGRFPDGSANLVTFPETPSPEASNFLPLTNVLINELLSHTDLPLEDAVEFYNPSASDVNLGGWYLSNNERDLRRFRIPSNTVVPAGGFKVLYEYQFGTPAGAGVLTPFTFNSAHGDSACLTPTNGVGGLSAYRARVQFGAATNGVSFGRYRDSTGRAHFVAQSRRTFGADAPVAVAEFRTGTGRTNAYPLVGPIVINEMMYAPPTGGLPDNTVDEYLELRNISSAPVTLFDPNATTNTWRIDGGVEFEFPSFTTLNAGDYLLLVTFDPNQDLVTLAAFRARYGLSPTTAIYGPYRGQLSNSGERLSLWKPDPPQAPPSPDAGFVPYVLVEEVDYSTAVPWPTNAVGSGMSLQRRVGGEFGNDPVNWRAAAPTAGSANANNVDDADGDGLLDAWEVQYFGAIDAPNAVPDLDVDLDGLTNLEEFLAGTDPTDAASALFLHSELDIWGAVQLRFTAVAGKSYTIEYRPALTPGAWQKLADVDPPSVTSEVRIPAGVGPEDERFYRLVTPRQP